MEHIQHIEIEGKSGNAAKEVRLGPGIPCSLPTGIYYDLYSSRLVSIVVHSIRVLNASDTVIVSGKRGAHAYSRALRFKPIQHDL